MMENYRIETETTIESIVSFVFECDNPDGLHMRAVGALQEMFVPGKMGRLYVRGELKSIRLKNDKMVEARPWKQVGSFDADNLFVAC